MRSNKRAPKEEADALATFARTVGNVLGTVAAKISPAKKPARKGARKRETQGTRHQSEAVDAPARRRA
jgi:hypothetical protein